MNRRAEAADIDARLAALPRPALDASTGARIHARTREAFVTSTADRAAATAAGRWARLWSRALEPAAVTIAVVVYLIWTAQALAAIDWGRIALASMNRVGSIGMPPPAPIVDYGTDWYRSPLPSAAQTLPPGPAVTAVLVPEVPNEPGICSH